MKTTKSFSIEDTIYKKFESICELKSINKSLFLQNTIKKFVDDNYEIDTLDLFKLKNMDQNLIDDNDFIKVSKLYCDEKLEKKYVVFENGNQLDIDTFDKLYEKIDKNVVSVMNYIKQNEEIIKKDIDDEIYDVVDPSFLNCSSISEEKFRKIVSNIDTTKINLLDKTKTQHLKERLENDINKGPFDINNDFSSIDINKVKQIIDNIDMNGDIAEENEYSCERRTITTKEINDDGIFDIKSTNFLNI